MDEWVGEWVSGWVSGWVSEIADDRVSVVCWMVILVNNAFAEPGVAKQERGELNYCNIASDTNSNLHPLLQLHLRAHTLDLP